jgi:hypothetical protein
MSKNTFVEPLPLSNVESGLAGERAQFLLNTWKDNSGVMIRDSRMTKLSPWLLLTLPSAEPGDVPKITFAGNQTTFRRFFPHALDPEAPKPATSFLPEVYRKGVADAYQTAIAGEPWLDIQRTGNRLGAGVPDMTLQRLLVRFETRSGIVRIFCLMELLEIHEQRDLSDHTRHPHYCPQKSGWHPAYQAMALPNSGHCASIG